VLVLVLGGLLAPLGFNALELPVLVSVWEPARPMTMGSYMRFAFRLSLRSRPLLAGRVSGCAGVGVPVKARFRKRIRYARRLRLFYFYFPPFLFLFFFVARAARGLRSSPSRARSLF
jgi:hypothetical protein